MITAYTRNITLLDAQDIVKRVVNSSLPNTSPLKKFPDLDKSGKRFFSLNNHSQSFAQVAAGFIVISIVNATLPSSSFSSSFSGDI